MEGGGKLKNVLNCFSSNQPIFHLTEKKRERRRRRKVAYLTHTHRHRRAPFWIPLFFANLTLILSGVVVFVFFSYLPGLWACLKSKHTLLL